MNVKEKVAQKIKKEKKENLVKKKQEHQVEELEEIDKYSINFIENGEKNDLCRGHN